MSWGQEPAVRRLMVEFGDSLDWRFIMGGLGRDYKGHERGAMSRWMGDAGEIDMPMDPLIWKESPISSSYPACMAAIAAGEQGIDAQTRYLRVLREGLMCFRRKLDSLEPFVEEARRVGLDIERFRIDAGSHGTVEAFGHDLDLTRDPPAGSPREDRVPFPSMRFGDGGWVFGRAPFDDLGRAAEAAGAQRTGGQLSVDEAFARFERRAPAEVAEICGLPGPRAHAELWRRAEQWQLKPLPAMTGYLFERV
jgi:hypothetical protein